MSRGTRVTVWVEKGQLAEATMRMSTHNPWGARLTFRENNGKGFQEKPLLGRSPGEGNGYPLQYSGLENSMDCIVHGVTKSPTRLSDFHFSLSDF